MTDIAIYRCSVCSSCIAIYSQDEPLLYNCPSGYCNNGRRTFEKVNLSKEIPYDEQDD